MTNVDVEEDDINVEDTDDPSTLVLIFTRDGKAILEEDDELVWASDDDDDFAETFDAELLDADDAEEILNYLEEAGFLEEEEKAEVEIEVEIEVEE